MRLYCRKKTVIKSIPTFCTGFFVQMDAQNKSNRIGKHSTLAFGFTAKKFILQNLLRTSNNVLNCHRDFRADVFKPLILSNPGPTASVIYSLRQANGHVKKKQTLVVASVMFTEKRLEFVLASHEATEFIGGLGCACNAHTCVCALCAQQMVF